MADAMTGLIAGTVSREIVAAINRIGGKVTKYMEKHRSLELPDAYCDVLDGLLKGTVPANKADALLEYLLDGGEPAKWAEEAKPTKRK